MGQRKLISAAALIGGLVILLVCLFADKLGIGGNPNAFGWKQTAGSIVGVIATISGLILLFRK